MAQFREREEDENDGIPVDLKQKVCPVCRRKVDPWEPTCPEDGAIPVEAVTMGSVEDQILGRLNPDLFDDLEDEADEDDDTPPDDEVVTVQTEPPPADLVRPPNFDETKYGGF